VFAAWEGLKLKSFITASVCLLIAGAGAVGLQYHRLASSRKLQVFRVVDLGTLGGDQTVADDVSSAGMAVGWSLKASLVQHAFICRKGKLVDLDPNPARASAAAEVNRNGVVVGAGAIPASSYPQNDRAFLWKAGVFHELPGLGGGFSQANGINESGTVVGVAATTDGRRHAVLWRGGAVMDLTPTARLAGFVAINARGEVAGVADQRVFLWREGKLTWLPSPYSMTTAMLGPSGEVVGSASGPKGADPFFSRTLIWINGGKPQSVSMPGSVSTSAFSVGAGGEVVGVSITKPRTTHAFLWVKGRIRDMGVPPGDDSCMPEAIASDGTVYGVAGRGLVGLAYGEPFAWSHGKFVALGIGGRETGDWSINRIVGVDARGRVLAVGIYRGLQHSCWLVRTASGRAARRRRGK